MLNRVSELYSHRVENVLRELTDDTDVVQWDVAPVTEMYYIDHEGQAKVDNLVCVWLYSFESDGIVLEGRAAFPVRTATLDQVESAVRKLWEQILVERLEASLHRPD